MCFLLTRVMNSKILYATCTLLQPLCDEPTPSLSTPTAIATCSSEPPGKKPKYVVRPAPIPPPPKFVATTDGGHHPIDKYLWLHVFSFLHVPDLSSCLGVCKTWYRWSLDASLWPSIDLHDTPLTQHHLVGIVRRQPKRLDLSSTNISHQQLGWLAARLPHLKQLSLAHCAWPAISVLCSSVCPLLFELDLSWVSSVRTACVRDLLAPPVDHRPGVDDSVSRLHRCHRLVLTGADVTDATLDYIARWLPQLQHLVLSYCVRLTDAGVLFLAACPSLQHLDLSACRGLTQVVLPHVCQIPCIETVRLNDCPQLNVLNFVDSHSEQFEFESSVMIKKQQ